MFDQTETVNINMADHESYLKRYTADYIKDLCVAKHIDIDAFTSKIGHINTLCELPDVVVPGAQSAGPAPVSTTNIMSILTSSCQAMNPVRPMEVHNLHKSSNNDHIVCYHDTFEQQVMSAGLPESSYGSALKPYLAGQTQKV